MKGREKTTQMLKYVHFVNDQTHKAWPLAKQYIVSITRYLIE